MIRSCALAMMFVLTAACEKKPAPAPAPGATPGATAAATGSAAATPDIKPVAAPATPGAGWTPFDGPTFTIKGPRVPTQKTTDVPTAAGTMPMIAYSFGQPGADRAYMVMTTKLVAAIKDADTAKMLIDARDGMVNRYGAKLDANADVRIGETPAIDFAAHGDHAQLGAFALRGRVAVKDGSLYQVMVLGPGHTQLVDAGAFVEGFALK